MGISMGDLRDCSMCISGLSDDVASGAVDCGSNKSEHQNNFMRDGKICASYCSGFRNITDVKNGLIRNEEALRFILAGKCEFTVVSGMTGVRLGFQLTKKKSTRQGGSEFIYYLSTMVEGNMVYCGILLFDDKMNKFRFAKGEAGKMKADHVNVKSILYILNNFHMKNTTLNLRIYHVGKCGRCGKKLTTPESIVTGLGPECSRLCGVPRIKVQNKDFV